MTIDNIINLAWKTTQNIGGDYCSNLYNLYEISKLYNIDELKKIYKTTYKELQKTKNNIKEYKDTSLVF